ncbi:MAG TPA: phage/plasmid primase, P4 family [Phycisphaerae bacterium]|nr:phage/plasmid primase, P4 family [Phycisphaerae bacterium]
MGARSGGDNSSTLAAVPRLPVKLPALPDTLTEASAARRFAEQYAARLRYDHRRKRWLVWSRHYWRPDNNGAVVRLVLEAARLWQLQASLEIRDVNRRAAVLQWAIGFERRAKYQALLGTAQNLEPLTDAGDRWDLDPWLLGVPNGVLDLRTGELRDGRPDDRITMQAGVAFDPDAACPRWELFMREIFGGDEELVDYVWRALGYSLTGVTSEQVLFLEHGTGANGKGTKAAVVRSVLGEYADNLRFNTLEFQQRSAIGEDLAALVGRRLLTAAETNDGTRLNEARIKALTGGDPITARHLYGEQFTFRPAAKFWLQFNHKPVVRDDSHGFWRRIRMIPFLQQFPVSGELEPALLAEGPGVLAWMVRGCLAWQERGLEAPAVVREATDTYRADSDVLTQFVDEALDLEPDSEMGASALFRHYAEWAKAAGFAERQLLSPNAFGRRAAERFRRVRTRSGWVYQGIARRFV